MPATHKVPPSSSSSQCAQAPMPAQDTQQVDKGKGRPTITPTSLSRLGTANTRSFSSLQPTTISTSHTPQSASESTQPSLLAPPRLAVIAPTPEASPVTPSLSPKRLHHKSVPETPSSMLRNPIAGGLVVPPVQKSWSSGSTGKRKAEDVEVDPGSTTPPKEQKEHRATFAPEPRTHRASSSSHAPSSYRRKRARLSLTGDGSNPPSRPASRTAMSSVAESPNSKNTGSWSSKRSAKGSDILGDLRRAGSSSTQTHPTRDNSYSRSYSHQGRGSTPASNVSHPHNSGNGYQSQPAPSRRSLSQASIPISALISPHAPSITHSGGTFHMRDPRKPAPIQSTPWSLSLPSQMESGESRWGMRGWVERGGSPFHAWMFFLGFVIFPVWWIASFVGVPQTRRLLPTGGVGGSEKGVVLDDPQVEYDARSWRTRCRVMAGVSLVTYIPFIVCVIVFAPR